MQSFEHSLIVGAALLVMSVAISKAGSRLGIPALLLFIVVGLTAGPSGLGIVTSSDATYELAQELGIFALVFILFSGGMETRIQAARKVLWPGLILSTLGVVIASAVVGIFARVALGFTLEEGCLLGATIASTDVAAVFSVLRAKNVSLKEGIAPLLELESALNDPMAIFLGIAFLGLTAGSNKSILGLLPLFVKQMLLGGVFGWVSGRGAVLLINRIRLEYDGLYPVLTMGWIVLTYAVSQSLGASGFLAVYVAAIVIGNANLLHRKSLVHFHEGIAWLGQICMFLVMGLMVNPHALLRVAPTGLALSAFLILVARPLSVFASIGLSRFSVRDCLMISWAGLRGAVPIILASYVLVSRIIRATDIFNLVFFVTFVSVLLQGTGIPLVARWLKVVEPSRPRFRFPIEMNQTESLKGKLVEIPVPAGAQAVGKSLLELDLPKDVLIVLIQREGDILVPRGGTLFNANDTLLVLCERTSPETIRARLVQAQA
ncbi:MAG TPA: potassium/proton antiporter [Bdellovibrionota bacterium]|nr:potassium/proton antiporter [Bdellovibrionota bacterium]